MKTEYLSIQEAADELGVSHWVIWSACHIGTIPSIRPGSRPGTGFYRIKRSDFDAYVRACTVKAPRPKVVEFASEALLMDRVLRRSRRRA